MQAANSYSTIKSIAKANLAELLYQAVRGSREELLEEPQERHRDWARALVLFVAYQKKYSLLLNLISQIFALPQKFVKGERSYEDFFSFLSLPHRIAVAERNSH
jgi:hypothetical protein